MPRKYRGDGDIEYGDLDDVIADTDVLYVTRVQKERIPGAIDIDFNYAVTSKHMARARDDMALMHPMPRVGEIPASLDNDPRSAYFRQMRYGLYVRMALLVAMLGVGVAEASAELADDEPRVALPASWPPLMHAERARRWRAAGRLPSTPDPRAQRSKS